MNNLRITFRTQDKPTVRPAIKYLIKDILEQPISAEYIDYVQFSIPEEQACYKEELERIIFNIPGVKQILTINV